MALNGSSGVVVTSQDSLWFNWWQISQDTINNSTTIGWNLTLTSGASGAISSSATKSWWVKVNGAYYEGTNTIGIAANSSKVLASGSTTIPHNADGTKEFSYSFAQYFGMNWGGSKIESKSGSGTGTLEPIVRQANLTSAPSAISDEDIEATIFYNNPVDSSKLKGLQACIGIDWDVLIPYRDIDPNGTSYTFWFTEAERELLRGAVTSGTSKDNIYFYIATLTTDGGVYYSRLQTTLILVNAEPIIAPSIEDVNPVTQALVGNNSQRFIYGESNLYYDFTTSGRKGATITSYSVKCGSYTSSSPTGTIYNILPSYNDYFISCSVVDSRGNKAETYVPLDIVWYNRPECYLEENSLSTSSGNLYFDVRCYWFDGYFDGTTNGSDGGVKNEGILQYRYKLEDGEYGEWINADPNEVTLTYPEEFIDGSVNERLWRVGISGLDYTSTYKVQIRLMDKVVTSDLATISDEYTMRMIPVFDWSREDFAINVPAYLNDGLSLLDNEGGHSEVMKYGAESEEQPYGLEIALDNFTKASYGGATEDSFQYDTTVYGNNVKLTSLHDIHLTPAGGQVYVNFTPLDYIVEQGQEGHWYYRKWNSGMAELYGWCEPTYQTSYYLSTYQPFPIALSGWISATGTVNGFTGNLAAYLGVNVKIECFNTGCNVWVQNPKDSFPAGTTTGVSIHVIGRWY